MRCILPVRNHVQPPADDLCPQAVELHAFSWFRIFFSAVLLCVVVSVLLRKDVGSSMAFQSSVSRNSFDQSSDAISDQVFLVVEDAHIMLR